MDFIFRHGHLVVVPVDYAKDAQYRALVERLLAAPKYRDAVAVLEGHPESWLALDLLGGAPWSRRFLLTTAKLWQTDRKLADRGLKAVMGVLTGEHPKPGRPRVPTLSAADLSRAAEVFARWKAIVDPVWANGRTVESLVAASPGTLSKAHQQALRALFRRRRIRRSEVILALVSWEMGIPVRRLRKVAPVASVVYG